MPPNNAAINRPMRNLFKSKISDSIGTMTGAEARVDPFGCASPMKPLIANIPLSVTGPQADLLPFHWVTESAHSWGVSNSAHTHTAPSRAVVGQ